MAREWTDEQDAIAYDTFKTAAYDKGIAAAVELMRGIMAMGADFTMTDVRAWIGRYRDEEVHPAAQAALDRLEANQERAADEFVFRNSTI